MATSKPELLLNFFTFFDEQIDRKRKVKNGHTDKESERHKNLQENGHTNRKRKERKGSEMTNGQKNERKLRRKWTQTEKKEQKTVQLDVMRQGGWGNKAS